MKDYEAIKGECCQMCPQQEIEWREKHGLLHKLEMLEGTENCRRPKADVNKCVKEFVRSAVGGTEVDLSTLRPGRVLMETVNYLLTKVVPVKDVSWNVVYDYVFDRLRAIRQDLVIQNIQGNTKIYVLENCVLFHLYSSLCEEELRLFDPSINWQHLQECLDMLLVQFDESSGDQVNSRRRYLFEAIYILHNLDSFKALQRFGCVPKEVRRHELVVKCYKISIYNTNRNYYRVLQEIVHLPNVLKIAVNRHINHIHFEYLRTMSVAYHSMNCRMAMTTVAQWLCPFETQELAIRVLRQLCRDYGIKLVANVAVQFDKNAMIRIEKSKIRKWGDLNLNFEKHLLNL